jgi:hypothetical protein
MINQDSKTVAGGGGSKLFKGTGDLDGLLEEAGDQVRCLFKKKKNEAGRTYMDSFLTTCLKVWSSLISGSGRPPPRSGEEEERRRGAGRSWGMAVANDAETSHDGFLELGDEEWKDGTVDIKDLRWTKMEVCDWANYGYFAMTDPRGGGWFNLVGLCMGMVGLHAKRRDTLPTYLMLQV